MNRFIAAESNGAASESNVYDDDDDECEVSKERCGRRNVFSSPSDEDVYQID